MKVSVVPYITFDFDQVYTNFVVFSCVSSNDYQCNFFYVENESDKKRRRVHVWESGSSGSESGQFLVNRFFGCQVKHSWDTT